MPVTTAANDVVESPLTPAAREASLIHRWRGWVTRHPIGAAALGGFVGVHVASVLGFWMGGFGLKRLDWNTANGLVYLPEGNPLAQFLFGGLMHYTDGILFGILFAITLHPRLRFGNSEGANVLKGVIFGTILSFIALLVLTPLVYAPARGFEAGFFSLNFGWTYVISVFIFHWVYGAHLGLIFNPLDKDRTEH